MWKGRYKRQAPLETSMNDVLYAPKWNTMECDDGCQGRAAWPWPTTTMSTTMIFAANNHDVMHDIHSAHYEEKKFDGHKDHNFS